MKYLLLLLIFIISCGGEFVVENKCFKVEGDLIFRGTALKSNLVTPPFMYGKQYILNFYSGYQNDRNTSLGNELICGENNLTDSKQVVQICIEERNGICINQCFLFGFTTVVNNGINITGRFDSTGFCMDEKGIHNGVFVYFYLDEPILDGKSLLEVINYDN